MPYFTSSDPSSHWLASLSKMEGPVRIVLERGWEREALWLIASEQGISEAESKSMLFGGILKPGVQIRKFTLIQSK
jgi:hypothetical protein